jgi:hypothetical protein
VLSVRSLGRHDRGHGMRRCCLLSENVTSRSGRSSSTSVDVAERIQRILASKGLTLYQASQQSIALFGRPSPYYLPHNLYYDLRHGPFTPSIFQVFALSRISGYRVLDWMYVLGIDLENVLRLQALLARKRTAVIDSTLIDTHASVPWFRSRAPQNPLPEIAPLAQLLERIGPRRISPIAGVHAGRFFYAKIGTQDALAFPDLLPGSIVRANAGLIRESLPQEGGHVSQRIFLFEHSKGLFCSRVRRARENVIVPVGTELSYAQVELRVQSEARILGVVDFEVRGLVKFSRPEVPNELAKLWKPTPIVERRALHQLMNVARTNAGLSFRDAAGYAQSVSNQLGDLRYRVSASSLCDYEVQGTPPRGLHRFVTLCSVYAFSFESFLRSIGIPVEQAGTEAMPDHLTGRTSSEESGSESMARTGFLEHLIEICKDVPFFLRNTIAPLTGLGELSIDDLFWIGGVQRPLHPYFVNGLLAVVHRRRKTPHHFPSKPLWKQPVYLLLQRDGTHLCACCDVENSTLVIHPYTEHVPRLLHFRYRKDVEVVGQIVAIARRLA